MAFNKLEDPTTTVTFLGIVIHTARMELLLPLDKLVHLRALACSWLGRRSGRRSDLESLLGHLSCAAVVVKPGRIFLQQLFSQMAKASKRHYRTLCTWIWWLGLIWLGGTVSYRAAMVCH